MNQKEALALMKAPGDFRPGIWRGGVIQIKVTNICNLDCKACTAAVGVGKGLKKYWSMTPDQFRTALQSCKGTGRVLGMFGGNPCTHKAFPELCAIFKEEIPDQDQRGLWSNNLMGHAKLCRDTFSPHHSNLNVHRVSKAFQEIAEHWPEALQARPEFMEAGVNSPSMHGSWWTAMRDVIPDEGERWELISHCFVNQTWSAEITMIKGELRAFFCEFAGTRAEFADELGERDTGLPVVPGWWNQPMEYFKEQVCHHCHRCGAPLNPKKVEDLGNAPEDYTATNAPLFEALPKRSSRRVSTLGELTESGSEPATKYLAPAMIGGGKK